MISTGGYCMALSKLPWDPADQGGMPFLRGHLGDPRHTSLEMRNPPPWRNCQWGPFVREVREFRKISPRFGN